MKKINIPLEDQVVELETAKELTEKLRRVGVEVENEFTFFNVEDDEYYGTDWTVWKSSAKENSPYREAVDTYTLPELLELLPGWIPSKYKKKDGCKHGHSTKCAWYGRCNGGDFNTEKLTKIGYIIGYTCRERQYIGSKCDDNPATAAAKLAIWCIDNGYIGGEIERKEN